MSNHIVNVLGRLEGESEREKKREISVRPEDRMLAITPETGRFLNILLKAIKAKNILEIGMSVGYSTIWFAEALENDGKIITIEKNPDKIKRAKKNFQEAGVLEHIEIVNEQAVDVLRRFCKSKNHHSYFDFVFIDADKENCITYFDLVLPLVRKGGLIVTDNILYPEKYRKDMADFTKHIASLPNVSTVTLAIGNGEEVSIKNY